MQEKAENTSETHYIFMFRTCPSASAAERGSLSKLTSFLSGARAFGGILDRVPGDELLNTETKLTKYLLNQIFGGDKYIKRIWGELSESQLDCYCPIRIKVEPGRREEAKKILEDKFSIYKWIIEDYTNEWKRPGYREDKDKEKPENLHS